MHTDGGTCAWHSIAGRISANVSDLAGWCVIALDGRKWRPCFHLKTTWTGVVRGCGLCVREDGQRWLPTRTRSRYGDEGVGGC